MIKSNYNSLIILAALLLSFYLASCSSMAKDGKCRCTIDASTTEINDMKKIKLNVDKNKEKQLFHVQPIIKDTTNGVVGIVALAGNVNLTNEGDSIVSITFELVHEDESRKLGIDTISLSPLHGAKVDLGGRPEIIYVYTSYDSVAHTQLTLPFSTPRPIGTNGYHGDIDFRIGEDDSYSLPRICEFYIK